MQRLYLILAALCYKTLQSMRRKNREHVPSLAVFADDDLGLRISLFGEFETEILTYLRNKFSQNMKDKCLIDVGANIGNHTLGLRSHFSTIHAFEPNPRTYRLLVANTATFDNITCHQLAVSNKSRSVSFVSDPVNTGRSHVSDKDFSSRERNETSPIEVKAVALDETELKGKAIGFLKIDVEGHELEVLRGAEAILRQQRPMVMIELLATDIYNNRSESLDYLAECGYTSFSSIAPVSLKIYAISNIPVLRWCNHLIWVFETILFGSRRAQSLPININKLASKNYEAILVKQ